MHGHNGPPIANRWWRIEWSHDWWC